MRAHATEFRPPLALFAMIGVATLLLLGCGGGDGASDEDEPTAPASAPGSTVPTTLGSSSTTQPPPLVVDVDANSFRNVNEMTPVRGFFVDNLVGDLDATLAVAENPDGGVYPPGSLVQLVPTEAMVKREPGFSPATNDWEFFELVVSETGTEIRVRGGDEVVNSFGLSCANCHLQAEPQWDLICEQDHGCDPLPIGRDVFEVLQATDPRP